MEPKDSAVDKLYASKGPSWLQDTRTEAVKQQQKLWQELGTLHRLRVNLSFLSQNTTGMRQIILVQACRVVLQLIEDNRAAMKRLPNKKRLAQLEKDKGLTNPQNRV